MFTVRPFENRSLTWWNAERDNIDLSPAYQRKGGIWSEMQRAYLIDSILNGYDIPKLYMADFTYFPSSLNEKSRPYAVIDGRQRFETIFAFFDGTLALNDDCQILEEENASVGGMRLDDIRKQYPKLAGKFENFNITVMTVITDEQARINDLFVRLNSSRPLTGAEIRNAMKGKVPPLIRQVVDHVFFAQKARINNDRKQDHNVAAKLLLLEYRGTFVDTKRTSLDRFVDEGIRSEFGFEIAAAAVNATLDIMAQSFLDDDPCLSSRAMIPLLYWMARNNPQIVQGWRLPLLEFDDRRRAARRISGSQQIDQSILNFIVANRSPDDAKSYQVRYKILKDWFIQGGLKLSEK